MYSLTPGQRRVTSTGYFHTSMKFVEGSRKVIDSGPPSYFAVFLDETSALRYGNTYQQIRDDCRIICLLIRSAEGR